MMGILESIESSVKGVLRVGQTAGVLAQTGLGWLLGDRPPAPKLMRQTFEQLGSTYIKLGQFIASSPSLFPREYVEEFQYCLDKTPALPFSTIKEIIRQELKRPIDEVFASIDEDPLASASIAQVHSARLLTGEDVVLKVQKPGVSNILLTDLNFLYVAARVMEFLAPSVSRASLSVIISDIQKTMLEECDFVNESLNMEKFRNFLDTTNNTGALVPRVYAPWTSTKLLTMERLYGVPLTDLESIRKYTKDPEQTLIFAMNTWFESLMLCEVFHADVHAGNLMVLEDGRIGFIDFGIVGSIKRETWMAMMSLMDGLSQANYTQMAESMVQVGITEGEINTVELAEDLKRIGAGLSKVDPEEVMQGNLDEDLLNRVMMDMIETGGRHGVRFPREFALLIKQFLYFDRYTRILAPDLEVFADDRLKRLN